MLAALKNSLPPKVSLDSLSFPLCVAYVQSTILIARANSTPSLRTVWQATTLEVAVL
jgi:hypothetical protein